MLPLKIVKNPPPMTVLYLTQMDPVLYVISQPTPKLMDSVWSNKMELVNRMTLKTRDVDYTTNQ